MNDWTGGTNANKVGEEDESESSVVNIEDDANVMEAGKGTKQPAYAIKTKMSNSWQKK